jgi:hypothetical protein
MLPMYQYIVNLKSIALIRKAKSGYKRLFIDRTGKDYAHCVTEIFYLTDFLSLVYTEATQP